MPGWSVELHGVFRRYPENLNGFIEDAYERSEPGVCFDLRGQTYCVRFNDNIQTNITNGKVKRVRRDVVDVDHNAKLDSLLDCQRVPAAGDAQQCGDYSFECRATLPALEREYREQLIQFGIPLCVMPRFEGGADLNGIHLSILGHLPLHTPTELSNALTNAGAMIHTLKNPRAGLIVVRGYDPESVVSFVTDGETYPGLINTPLLRKQIEVFPHTLVVDEYLMHELLHTRIGELRDWAHACGDNIDETVLCRLTDTFYTKNSMRDLRACVGKETYIARRTLPLETVEMQRKLATVFRINGTAAYELVLAGCTAPTDLNDNIKGPTLCHAASLGVESLRSLPFYNELAVPFPREEIRTLPCFQPLTVTSADICHISTENLDCRACLTGCYRRGHETCDNIVVLLTNLSSTKTMAALVIMTDAFSEMLFQRLCGGGVWIGKDQLEFRDHRFENVASLVPGDAPVWWEVQHEMLSVRQTRNSRIFQIVSPRDVQEQRRRLRSSRTLIRVLQDDGLYRTYRNSLTSGTDYVELDNNEASRNVVIRLPGRIAHLLVLNACHTTEEPHAQLALTGPRHFYNTMREVAAQRAWTLNRRGLHTGRSANGQAVEALYPCLPAETESDIFAQLDLAFIAPADR